MSFFDYLQVIGSALVVAVCVFLVNNPVDIVESPVDIPQAAQLVASPSTKKLSRVEELVGSSEVVNASPERMRRVWSPHPIHITSLNRMPLVAGAQHNQPIKHKRRPHLKSCFKKNIASRPAKSVSFEGGRDSIRGRLHTFEVDELAPNYHQRYMESRQAPNVAFPLIREMDLEGNDSGWFFKRDSFYYPPTTAGSVAEMDEWHICTTCRGNLSRGLLDPMIEYPAVVLESEDPWTIEGFTKLDQIRRYHCSSHGGN